MGWLDKLSNGCSSRVMVPRVEAYEFQQIRVFTRILLITLCVDEVRI